MIGRRLRVLVVDDEPLARRSVVRHLAEVLPEAEVVEARNGFDALERVATFAPELLLLDVEMPELSGFDVLRQLPEPRPRTVFVTAHERFAVRAFEENACDYLVKPFSAERFVGAIERAVAQLDTDARLARLERTLSAEGEHLARLALRAGTRVDVIQVDDVELLRSEGRHTYVHTADREYVTELSLVHIEQRLDPARFVRVHRTAIVQLARVVRVEDSRVVLRAGLEAPLSRRSRSVLRERLLGTSD